MASVKKVTKDTPEKQSERFKETARKLGADERPEAFDKLIKKVAHKTAKTK